MYTYLFRIVRTARSSPVGVCERKLFPAICDKTAVFWTEGGVKTLFTNSVRHCEKKEDVAISNLGEKPNADPTETPTLAQQIAEDDGQVLNKAEQREEPALLKTDDGSSVHQQVDVKIENVVEKPEDVKTKSGKESLLDLLSAMKVEVTHKKRRTSVKVQADKPAPKESQPKMESTISMFQRTNEEAISQRETVDPEMLSAASAAASTLPNPSQAKSDLQAMLRQNANITEVQKKGLNLGEIITDMKIEERGSRQNSLLKSPIQFDEDGRGYMQQDVKQARVRLRTLSENKRLNIFSPTNVKAGEESAVARPTLWDLEFARTMSLSINQQPRNGLEEMIQWTKEGKMWQYPVNNEAGLDEEARVPFHEHVFLEEHLKEGFPRQGPVRHFMDLVVTGLSRNPYLTVQQKREHISWFRDYFNQKENVLKEAEVDLN